MIYHSRIKGIVHKISSDLNHIANNNVIGNIQIMAINILSHSVYFTVRSQRIKSANI